ncbi:MAG: DUF983 domain-containing protein [Cyclobacteriaceae bacterium]|nr:DUF983 domain-containing protein [Cyclobacteriaceae bacterium HetDA_MAG_MS6]
MKAAHRTSGILKNILYQRCPKCRKGNLFVNQVYNLKGFSRMYEKCPSCGQRFELEPSFYFGAMYVSYAQQVAWFVVVFISIEVLFSGTDLVWYLVSVGVLSIVLFPFTFRLSRSIWIHFFVKYDP